MTPIISLIFPVYNHAKMTIEALESLKKVPNKHPYEVIVVDDGSYEDMSSLFERTELFDVLIQLPQNTGNSTIVVNKGIEVAKGKYVMYQNNDVLFIQPFWLDVLVDTLELNPTIGALGLKALYRDLRVNHSMRIWQSADSSQSSSHYERGVALENSTLGIKSCPIIAGCGMTFPKKLWEELGGLTVYQPFGWDDADWCLKVQEAGYTVAVQNDCYFIHFGSVSYGGKETQEYYTNKKKIEQRFKDTLEKISRPKL